MIKAFFNHILQKKERVRLAFVENSRIFAPLFKKTYLI